MGSKGVQLMADESYPAELRYHREHDWARVEGETATFGITWFAQDNLQEIVYFDPPGARPAGDEGSALRRDRVREGGFGGVRTTVRRDRRSQHRARRRRRDDQQRSLRAGLAGQGEDVGSQRGGSAAERRGVPDDDQGLT